MQAYSKIQRKIISHPKSAVDEVRKILNRHAGRANTCLKCGCIWAQHIHHTSKSWVRNYRCTHCNKTYSEFLGTIFFRSKLKPSEWLIALLELSTATGGVSGTTLGKKIGRQRKTGWKLLKNIREWLLQKRSQQKPLFSWETEADEAWFGRGDNQEIILGIIQRDPRRVSVQVIPDVKERTLWPIVRNTITPGSLFCTDMRISYSIAGIHYHHATNNHSKREFGHRYTNSEWRELMIHSNTIEQLWWQFKWVIRTIHHGVSKKYRMSYLNEQIIRYEHGKDSNLYYYFLSLLFIPTFSGT
jgi:transposase-like protein